ncbi:MAG: DUF2784 family protein [Elusimicrobia bacterium]|nr:DUF2784 family protein [Elusimicrobiota bacterium]
MFWKISADVVALVHAACVVVMIFGPLWGWRKPFWRGVHLALLFVTAVAWSFYCPLSVFENVLRCRYDPSVGYDRGFLEHLKPIIDLRRHGSLIAWVVRGWLVLWAIIYGILWAREDKRKSGSASIPPH